MLEGNENECIDEGDIDQAELIANSINELREKEILLQNFIIIEQN